MRDDFEGWDEREAGERRKREGEAAARVHNDATDFETKVFNGKDYSDEDFERVPPPVADPLEDEDNERVRFNHNDIGSNQAAWDAIKAAKEGIDYDDPLEQEVEDFDPGPPRANGSEPPPPQQSQEPSPKPAFKLKNFTEIKMSTAPAYLVKDLIPRGGLVVVWGPPKCGKSFWVFDLTMHVALGWEYRGRRVQEGTVVYLALEGGIGFANRVEAWRRTKLDGGGFYVPFFLVDVPVDLVKDHERLVQSIKTQFIAHPLPAVVVIDTLNRALAGSENESKDMSGFIRAADAIRVAFNCAVIIVHHCGINGERPRGHSSLPGADDCQIAIRRDEAGVIVATVDHMKDGDGGAPIASRLERIELGNNDEGDLITSCVIMASEEAAAAPRLSKAARLAYRELCELVTDEPPPTEQAEPPPRNERIPRGAKPISRQAWRERFYAVYANDNPDSRKRAFARAVEQLQETGMIGIWQDSVWIARHRDIGT
jgi:hypothetical protein